MKNFLLLFCLSFLLTKSIHAQKTALPIIDGNLYTNATIFSNLKLVADTAIIYPIELTAECAGPIIQTTPEGQFVAGVNEFGDFEKGQRITIPLSDQTNILGVVGFFDEPTIVGNGNLTAKVYAATESGEPGELLATSLELASSDLSVPEDGLIQPTTFVLAEPLNVSDRTEIFVFIDFRQLYDAGDIAGLITTPGDCGTPRLAWEIWNDGSLNAMSEAWTGDSDWTLFLGGIFETNINDGSCEAAGGTIEGGPFSFCIGDGESNMLVSDDVSLEGSSGTNSSWVVTDTSLEILAVVGSFTEIEFETLSPGSCLLWHISYEDDLSGAEIGANAGDLGGCFSLSNSIEISRFSGEDCPCQVDGGEITGGPFTFCVGDGSPDQISADEITLSNASGEIMIWVATDTNLNIMSLAAEVTDLNFEDAGAGIGLIWHLSYEGDITGANIGANAVDLMGCFDLSNSLEVRRISTEPAALNGGPFTFCVGDEMGDSIAADAISVSGGSGENSQWVVTDINGTILLLPTNYSDVDFDDTGAGTCLIWYLTYSGELTGAQMGASALDLQGCLSLSNSIEVVRVSGEDCPSDCAVDGGTLEGGPFEFTVGDGEADMIPAEAITLADNFGENSQWVVTDADGTILGLPANYADVNFDDAGPGSCYIWNLSFDGDLTGAALDSNTANIMGCFDLSNSIEVIRTQTVVCDVDGGTLEGGPFEFTVGDGEADMIPAEAITLADNFGENSQWVVTDGDGTILGLPANYADVNFDDAGPGSCFIWNLSFDGDLTGAALDSNTANIMGCFNLSNSIEVIRTQAVVCDVDGGTLEGGPFEFTVGDGEADMIPEDEIILSLNVGENSQWVITDLDGNILGLPESFTQVDFDDVEAGTCLIWHLSFDGELTGAAVGNNTMELEGCFDLSNSIEVVRTEAVACDVDGGTLEGGPFEFTVGDGEADMIPAEAITLADNFGENSQWVVTDADGTILGLPANYADVNFDDAGPGSCFIWNLSFDGDLTGAALDSNTANIMGCFDLSNSIEIIRTQAVVCDVDGGTLEGGPFEFTVGDGEADMIPAEAITLADNFGENSQWVVTDADGTILGLPANYADVNFDDAGPGSCFIWNLSFDGNLTGAALDSNTANIMGCFDLSNSIEVIRTQAVTCDVDGGTLEGGPFEFTVGDGEADMIPAEAITLTDNFGENSQWVVTDADGTILGLPANYADVNFDDAGPGSCFIWNLSFDGDLTGAALDSNTANIMGCFDLSNSIEVIRTQAVTCDVDGGTLEGGPFEFTVGDGEADMIPAEAITLTDNFGENSQWVVTDADGTILGLPANYADVNFDDAGPGSCFIWNLSFDGDLTGAALDSNTANIMGCFELSNSIEVIRTQAVTCDVVGGTLEGGPFEVCVGDGEADFIPTDGIALSDDANGTSQWVVTDANGVILGLPAAFSAVDFDDAGTGTCLIWHLSFEGELTGAEVGSNTSGLEGCFDLSNPIEVVRVSGIDCQGDGGGDDCPEGGSLESASGETELSFCVGDGIPDPMSVKVSGSTGTNNAYVLTDEDLNILAIQSSSVFDFEKAGVGTCLLWHLSYEDGIQGAEVGANAADLMGCFGLSNPVTINRIDCTNTCHMPFQVYVTAYGPGRVTARWSRVSSAVGYQVVAGYEDSPGSIAVIPVSSRRLRLSYDPGRTLIIQVRAICAGGVASELTEPISFMTAASIKGSTLLKSGTFEGIKVVEEELSISPNPTHDFLNIEGLDAYENAQFEVISSDGRMIQNGTMVNRQISVNGINSGVYMLILRSDKDLITTKRFVKL